MDSENVEKKPKSAEEASVIPQQPVVGEKEDIIADDTAALPKKGEAWSITFTNTSSKTGKRKVTKRERLAMEATKERLAGTAATASTQEGEDGGVSGTTAAMKEVDGSAWIDLEVAIPRNLQATQEQLQFRNYIDQQQLMCMCRQYKASCGISSLTSVWNGLYSRIGHGTLPPVSQEEIMSILGFQPPFEGIRWGPFTGNTTLMRWFHAINAHFGVKGKCYYLWKAHGVGKTYGVQEGAAKSALHEAIRSPHSGIIYHCHNHYMVPLGFMEQPRTQLDIFATSIADPDSWIMIGEVSRGKHPPMHIKKWADIATDINCASPNFYNIRHTELGVQTRERCKKPGGNLHCLMVFRSDLVEDNMEQFEQQEGGDGDGDENNDDVDDENVVGASPSEADSPSEVA